MGKEKKGLIKNLSTFVSFVSFLQSKVAPSKQFQNMFLFYFCLRH